MNADIKLRFVNAVKAACQAVGDRQEEINRLNVFPIPDGDTGTNVTLTMQNVVKELDKLPDYSSMVRIFRAIKRGSLMGARGNSGVITSQILRGISEGAAERTEFDPSSVAYAFQKAQEVSYHAVRKPVEGTILTVIKDAAIYAQKAADDGVELDDMLRGIAKEAFESVKRTPDLMPTLKENGVVDSGGLALAVMLEGFVNSFLGDNLAVSADDDVFAIKGGKVAIEQLNDWENHNFRYCTEFLFQSRELDVEEAYDFLASMGDCELIVGDHPDFKVHVHTDQPGIVLTWMIERGQPHEIFIHNMDMQSEERLEKIAADNAEPEKLTTPPKPLGYVAVAVGSGNIAILESLGVDKVVSGGQTMNPSTSDIVEAINDVNAEKIIVFPGNKNIVMSANSAAELVDKPCGVVPTKSLPQTFTAIFSGNPEMSLDENVEMMIDAIEDVVTCEVTTAVKDAVTSDGVQIREGDVMGIIDGAIELVGSDIHDVCIQAIDKLASGFVDNITLLAGEDMDDEELQSLTEYIEENYEDLEVDANRGEQPLYPLILSVE